MKEKTIEIFGIKYKSENPDLRINRERYAIIDKKNHFQKNDQILRFHGWHLRHEKYEDDEYEYYSDEYCIEHQKDCLYNYDSFSSYWSSCRIFRKL